MRSRLGRWFIPLFLPGAALIFASGLVMTITGNGKLMGAVMLPGIMFTLSWVVAEHCEWRSNEREYHDLTQLEKMLLLDELDDGEEEEIEEIK